MNLFFYPSNILLPKITRSLLLSTHTLRHRQGHDGGGPNNSHRLRQQCEVGGSSSQEALGVKHRVCRKTHSRDNPSDRHGTRLSDSLHQKVCCGQQEASLQSGVLSAPTLWGRLEHHRYLHGKVHAPASTSSCSSSAPAG